MAVCSKCGKEQYYGEKFCYSCGAPVIDEGEVKAAAASDVKEAQSTNDICPHCGAKLKGAERFCASCGGEITKGTKDKLAEERCAKCGNPIKEGELFCSACGTEIPFSKDSEAIYKSVNKISLKLRYYGIVGISVFLLWLLLAQEYFYLALITDIVFWAIPFGVFYIILRFFLLKKAKLTLKQYRDIRKKMKKKSKNIFRKSS